MFRVSQGTVLGNPLKLGTGTPSFNKFNCLRHSLLLSLSFGGVIKTSPKVKLELHRPSPKYIM